MNFRGAFVILILIPQIACAFSRGRVALDPVTASSILDGDATGLVEGCGNQPIVGFTYCRTGEGDASSGSLSFIGPPAKCDQKDGCVFIKVWNNQGVLIWGGGIEKGKTRVLVPWSTLLSSPTFELGHRGFWTWTMQVYFKDPDGRERISTAQGDVILRVYRKDYVPLNQVESDPAFVWNWVDGKCQYKATAGLRAYIKCLP